LPCGGVVLQDPGERLAFVDLQQGKRSLLPSEAGLDDIRILCADESKIWFSALDQNDGKQYLLSWDMSMNQSDEKGNYLQPCYSADNPDKAGLQACREQAKALGDKYGVSILLWEDALDHQPQNCTFEAEYRVEIYQRDLEVLEQALGNFPEGFFQKAAAGSENGNLTICLVRGLQDAQHSGESGTVYGAQYWMGESAYIALAMGQQLEAAFYHTMSHLIDNRVISTSKAYDDWGSLNPADFMYDYDYVVNRLRADAGYLEPENRVFIDTYAMSFPKEDRARILEYAMLPGNEAFFASEQMQKKLETVCNALREVFDLDPGQRYAWEQYLAK